MTRVTPVTPMAPLMRVNLRAALMTVMLTAAAVGASVAAGGTVAAGRAAAQSGPPLDDASAKARLAESSRHGEYVDISVPGGSTPIRAFVVYPEIATKAAVIVVLHDGYKLTDWVRGVADQVAADGFIAIAPELPSGTMAHDPAARAVHAYGEKLPAATGKTTSLLLQGTPRFADWAATVAALRRQTQ